MSGTHTTQATLQRKPQTMFRRIEVEEPPSAGISVDEPFAFDHPTYYEVHGVDMNEQNLGTYRIDEDESDVDEDYDDEGGSEEDYDEEETEEAFRRRLRRPMLSLSNREKNDICRYRNMKPETSLRQISEHFSQLWNKIVCPRSVYDTLVQNEKWTQIENRVRRPVEFLSQNPVDDIERLLLDWITEIIKEFFNGEILLQARAEARVWDEDVRNAAAIIRDIRSLKGFMPSPTWLNDFKYKHKFEIEQTDGSIISHEIEKPEEDPLDREKRQIRIDIGDGLSYQINVGARITCDTQKEKVPPLSLLAATPFVRRGGPHVPPNRMTDIQLADSDEDDDGQLDVGFQLAPQDDGLETVLGSACSSSFHDVLKHFVYGSNVMSERAQEIMSAATEVALNAELFGEGSDEASRKRSEKRAKLNADLVEKVLEAKRRRDEALKEMYQKKKLRDLNAFKVAEEQRKRSSERRELYVVQKKILELEERFFCDQQRNELIRKELLLVEEPIVTTESDSGKQAKVLQPSGTAVKRRRTGLATVIGGAD